MGRKWGVDPICKALQVAPSTYYQNLSRPLSKRALRDQVMMPILLTIFVANLSVYGARKLWIAACNDGHDIGRDQVARLMRSLGIRGVARRWKPPKTTVSDGGARPPDLVDRDFTAEAPNQLWVTDLTYVRTTFGFVYTVFITDAFSRAIVGWATSLSMTTDLMLSALETARRSRGNTLEGLVAHSDAGTQYTSLKWGQHLAEMKAVPSVGSVADSYDNALSESVNALYKCELIHGPKAPELGWETVEAVELATLNWVHWWNTSRIHSYCGDRSPEAFERAYNAGQAALAAETIST